MFDNGVDELDVDQTLDRAAASRARVTAAEAESLLLGLHYADLNATLDPPPPGGEIVPGTERLRVYGGEGCPPIAEFCAQEFGWRLGMSHGAAAAYLGEALALRHRFPKTLAQVLAGNAEAWRARWIARTCQSLSLVAAGIVDEKVHAIIDSVSPSQLRRIVAAAKMQADPAKAKADADLYARQRGVWLGQSNDDGTKSVVARTAVGDAVRFDAAVEEFAGILARCGDTGSRQQRRARAVGLLADPRVALALREHGRRQARTAAAQDAGTVHDAAGPAAEPHSDNDGVCAEDGVYDTYGEDGTDAEDGEDGTYGTDGEGDTDAEDCAGGADSEDEVPVDRLLADLKARHRSQAPHTFYVRISQESLASGEGVAWVEGIGPLLVSQVKELVGHEAVVVKPVIDLRQHHRVDGYQVPQRIREWVKLRYPTPMEPWATTETTFSTDLDHVVPYDQNGPPGQTSTTNLIPVTRTPHRAKTHGGLRNALLPDGSVEWTTPRGARYLVDHTGTRYLGQVNRTTGELTPPPQPNGAKRPARTNAKRKAGKKYVKNGLSRIGLASQEVPDDCA